MPKGRPQRMARRRVRPTTSRRSIHRSSRLSSCCPSGSRRGSSSPGSSPVVPGGPGAQSGRAYMCGVNASEVAARHAAEVTATEITSTEITATDVSGTEPGRAHAGAAEVCTAKARSAKMCTAKTRSATSEVTSATSKWPPPPPPRAMLGSVPRTNAASETVVTSALTILRVMGALLYETRVRVLSCVIIITTAKKCCSRLGGANKVSVNFDTERYNPVLREYKSRVQKQSTKAEYKSRVQKQSTKAEYKSRVQRTSAGCSRSSMFAVLLWIGRRLLSTAPFKK